MVISNSFIKTLNAVAVFAAVFTGILTSSENAQAYTFDRNVPADIATQMRADLNFMNTLQGSQVSALHKEIFGEMNGAGYQQFFESRIKSIGQNACGGGNAVACVIPMMGSNRMFITQNYIKFSHPAIARLMVVYHESRHSEVAHGNWPHATCPTPFQNDRGEDMHSIWTGASLAGEPACDITPYGSYGSSTILLKNISKFCTNCTDKVKMDAGIYADDQIGRITDADAKAAMMKDVFSAK